MSSYDASLVTLYFFSMLCKVILTFHVMFKLINCVFLSESQKAAHSDIVTWCEIIVFSHFAVFLSEGNTL